VDPGGGKDPACPCADGQSLVAGSFVRDLSWADDFADPYGGVSFQIDFDFIDHTLTIQTSKGQSETIVLGSRTVAISMRR
jgi:hypothetical protein